MVLPSGAGRTDPIAFGAWESSGVLDVTKLFGAGSGVLFVASIQASGIGGGVIKEKDLVLGGQLIWIRG